MNTTKICLTSDTHDSHANIIKYDSRPWTTIEEMRAGLLDNINKTAGENDVLYHLGDIACGPKQNAWEFLDGIKCKNIHLVLGNHDRKTYMIEENKLRKRLLSISKRIDTSFVWKGHHYSVTMTHYPPEIHKRSDSHLYLCGHVHRKDPVIDFNCFDIGCRGHNCTPWSLDEVMELYHKCKKNL